MRERFFFACGPRQAWMRAVSIGTWAFPTYCRHTAQTLDKGSIMLMYMTASAYGYEERHEARRFGCRLYGAVETMSAISYQDRHSQTWPGYPYEINIRPLIVLDDESCVDIRPLIKDLLSFPDKNRWNLQIRKSLFQLHPVDGERLFGRLAADSPKHCRLMSR